jgi:hypothetical protein
MADFLLTTYPIQFYDIFQRMSCDLTRYHAPEAWPACDLPRLNQFILEYILPRVSTDMIKCFIFEGKDNYWVPVEAISMMEEYLKST